MRFFDRRGGGVFDNAEKLAPVRPDGSTQQRGDVHRRGGGGDSQMQPGLVGFFDQVQHARAQADRTIVHHGLIGRCFELMQPAQGVAHAGAADIAHLGVTDAPVMQEPLLAAGDIEQPGVQRLVPVPVHALLGKGRVKSGAVGGFGVGQGAVYIKNQGVEHGGQGVEVRLGTAGSPEYQRRRWC